MRRLSALAAGLAFVGCTAPEPPYSPLATNADQAKAGEAATARLTTYKKLEGQRFQIPIERSMALTAQAGIKYPETFVAPAKGDAPAAPVGTPKGDPPAAFAADPAKVEQGKALFAAKTCAACHSVDGSKIVGPSLKGFWGRAVAIQGGEPVWADGAYFTESVKSPTAKISAGFPPAMPTLPLTDAEIDALQHYVASLK